MQNKSVYTEDENQGGVELFFFNNCYDEANLIVENNQIKGNYKGMISTEGWQRFYLQIEGK